MSKKPGYDAVYTFTIPKHLKCSVLQIQRFQAGLDATLEYLDGRFLTVRDGRYFHRPTSDVCIELWAEDMSTITAKMVQNAAKDEVVRSSKSTTTKPQPKSTLPERFLFVGGLHPKTTPSNLQNEFSKYGTIVRINFHKKTKLAYVYFEDIRDAEDALNELNGRVINGKPLLIEWCRPAVNGN